MCLESFQLEVTVLVLTILSYHEKGLVTLAYVLSQLSWVWALVILSYN